MHTPAITPIKRKSAMKGSCALVWTIAEEMLPQARRRDILAACVARGIAYNTARTQFQRYTEAVRGDTRNA